MEDLFGGVLGKQAVDQRLRHLLALRGAIAFVAVGKRMLLLQPHKAKRATKLSTSEAGHTHRERESEMPRKCKPTLPSGRCQRG